MPYGNGELRRIGMNSEVLAVTVFVFAASTVLSLIISSNYIQSGKRSFIFWASGMWLFAFAALLEILFAAGTYSEVLIDLYLFLVAVLVQLLSAGSLLLLNSATASRIYGVYALVADAALAFALISGTTGNIILNGVVYGSLPVEVIAASSAITFPAAAILVAVSIISFRRKRTWKMLSIISGTVVVSAAGALYIASFPSFLYVAELAGIILLWAGFVDFSRIFSFVGVKKHVHG